MARLTEEMVIARTRASDLSNIKKLNCWGSDLQDVSLLRRMHNVEVLSLSVNKINNLSDFQFCRNLQELYVRKNEIRDLNQICYLQDLPRLKNLWLEENPCASVDHYRMTVLRALPHLQKLDNVVVQPEEVQDAGRKGRELLHPEDLSPDCQWPSALNSPDCSPAQEQEYGHHVESPYYSDSYYDEYEESERVVRPQSAQRATPRRAVATDRNVDSEPSPRKLHTPADEQSYYETDRRNANYEPDLTMSSRQNSNHYISSEVACNSVTATPSDREASPRCSTRRHSLHHPSSPSCDHSPDHSLSCTPRPSPRVISLRGTEVGQNVSQSSDEVQRMRSNSSYHMNQDSRDSGSEGSGGGSQYNGRGKWAEDDVRSQPCDHTPKSHPQVDNVSQRISGNTRPVYPRRPTTKNSNILSAVLCLIKELDYPSLEVVEMAVRSRIDEF